MSALPLGLNMRKIVFKKSVLINIWKWCFFVLFFFFCFFVLFFLLLLFFVVVFFIIYLFTYLFFACI